MRVLGRESREDIESYEKEECTDIASLWKRHNLTGSRHSVHQSSLSQKAHIQTHSHLIVLLYLVLFSKVGVEGKNILKAARKRPVTPGDELSWWTRREAKR